MLEEITHSNYILYKVEKKKHLPHKVACYEHGQLRDEMRERESRATEFDRVYLGLLVLSLW